MWLVRYSNKCNQPITSLVFLVNSLSIMNCTASCGCHICQHLKVQGILCVTTFLMIFRFWCLMFINSIFLLQSSWYQSLLCILLFSSNAVLSMQFVLSSCNLIQYFIMLITISIYNLIYNLFNIPINVIYQSHHLFFLLIHYL
jgi:hypothetical protein